MPAAAHARPACHHEPRCYCMDMLKVAQELWFLAVVTTCGPGVTMPPVCLSPTFEQPRRAPACAGGAHCPSSAHGDLAYVGTQHMQSLG